MAEFREFRGFSIFSLIPGGTHPGRDWAVTADFESLTYDSVISARSSIAKLDFESMLPIAKIVREGACETFSYYGLPREHWRSLRTNNPLERIMREIRRRTRVMGAFPDGRSALMLVAARLRYIAGTRWGTRRYLNMDRLTQLDKEIELTG